MVRVIVLMISVLMVAACASPKKENAQKTELKGAVIDEHVGEQAYKRHCLACHQRDAGGVPGMYPPLANNKLVSGDKAPLIHIMLNGMSGEIEVNGQKYNGVMASYSNLSDDEIADILNYIRSGFGNEGQEITASDVKALR